MNREETRKAAEVMLHYANGGEVLVGSRYDSCHMNTVDPAWSWDSCVYHVKPKEIEIRQWCVMNKNTMRVVTAHDYLLGAQQCLESQPWNKFLVIVELKGTYTCDT